MTEIINYFINLPWLELAAMLLSLAYVILAAKGSLWCWPAAFISTALYSYIFYDVLLLMDSALNIYYLAMAVYGYWCWKKHKNTVSHHENSSQPSSAAFNVVSWQASWHINACLILTICATGLGYVMASYTPAAFPYLDTFTTVFAVFATYLVTQKVLENWLYWLVIDAVSIYLYLEKDLLPTAFLFVVYIIIASYGYIKWRALYQQNRPTNLTPQLNQ